MKTKKCSQNIDGKVTFRAPQKEIDEIKKRAEARNMSVSSFLRQQALSGDRVVTNEERQEYHAQLLNVAAICAELNSSLYKCGLQSPYTAKLNEIKEKLIKLCVL